METRFLKLSQNISKIRDDFQMFYVDAFNFNLTKHFFIFQTKKVTEFKRIKRSFGTF